jgi:hypothetical protein
MKGRQAPTTRTGVSLWRHRDFMLLWGGQTVNLFGSQISWLAVPMIAIVTLHATKFQVAALGAVEALPALHAERAGGAKTAGDQPHLGAVPPYATVTAASSGPTGVSRFPRLRGRSWFDLRLRADSVPL